MTRVIMIVVGTIVVLVGAAALWLVPGMLATGREGGAFMEKQLRAIASDWSVETLLDAATPQLRSRSDPERLQEGLRRLDQRLGSVERIEILDTGAYYQRGLSGVAGRRQATMQAVVHGTLADANVYMASNWDAERGWRIMNFDVQLE